jgi:hypothetical protein
MDKEGAIKQLAAIKQSLEEINKDLELYSSLVEDDSIVRKDLESIAKVNVSHTKLVASVRTLNRAARGPVDSIFAHTENVSTRNSLKNHGHRSFQEMRE